jgi:hypothetical protein
VSGVGLRGAASPVCSHAGLASTAGWCVSLHVWLGVEMRMLAAADGLMLMKRGMHHMSELVTQEGLNQ